MEVKALWGFMGEKGRVLRGEKMTVSNEYGHSLIGKGLVEEVKAKEETKKAPSIDKQTGPKENK